MRRPRSRRARWARPPRRSGAGRREAARRRRGPWPRPAREPPRRRAGTGPDRRRRAPYSESRKAIDWVVCVARTAAERSCRRARSSSRGVGPFRGEARQIADDLRLEPLERHAGPRDGEDAEERGAPALVERHREREGERVVLHEPAPEPPRLAGSEDAFHDREREEVGMAPLGHLEVDVQRRHRRVCVVRRAAAARRPGRAP